MDNVENGVNTKKVSIDLTINGVDYKGEAFVDLQTSGVFFDEHLNVSIENNDYFASYRDEDSIETLATTRQIVVAEALHQAGVSDVCKCCVSGFYGFYSDMQFVSDYGWCFRCFTVEFQDEYYLRRNCAYHSLKNEYGEDSFVIAPQFFWDDCYFCGNCGSYVRAEDYDTDFDGCRWCARENSVIEDYCESHDHTPIYFGEYEDEDSFVGFGFELEVDCSRDNAHKNDSTARNLCYKSGLDDDEMRFAHDGSLDYGFECISQPHTIKDFWCKQDKWRKMLKYLSSQGYKSHDTNTCGLHIHVSRGFFGNTDDIQSGALAKVYMFFEENWDDIVKISRRKSFNWCQKSKLENYSYDSKISKYKNWKKICKDKYGNHHLALNNANKATFEYRIGRGTLNAWSFFAWIDFILTISKNAKRITVNKVESNDLLSWLGGIKESTAKYIYKRGAFKDGMLALYPNIEWESDLTDTNE